MGPVPLAFSVHNFISSVGADAGFAAIIGLAILVLLYFAHARETANLREEATALGERLRQAEAAVAQLARAQAAPAPAAAPSVPPPASVQVTDHRAAPAPSVASAPFAPLGMGAPALASATRMIPVAAPQPPSETPQSTESEPASPARVQPAVATAAAAGVAHSLATAREPAPVGAPASGASSGVPGPATVAGANGAGNGPARPAPVGAGLGGGARQTPPGAPATPRTLPPLDRPGQRRSSTGRNVLLALGALVVVAAAVALVLITSTETSSHTSASTQTSNAPAVSTVAAFKPASVTVAVLNGTSTNELAHRVGARLAASGYKEGKVATASNQTATSTVVAYLPGAKNRADALHVARTLKLTPAAVRPIDQPTQQVACPPPGACTANVVVTVGADLATL